MSKQDCILVVEDDLDACNMLVEYLGFEGFDVNPVHSGHDGLNYLKHHAPDIILLDIMMPQMSGIEMLKHIRRDSDVPVLMLTAKHDDTAKVLGLELGADDYLTKPYNPSELTARIKAILRRTKTNSDKNEVIRVADFTLVKKQREARINNTPIELTLTEYNLLEFFTVNIDQVLSKELLFKKVIGREFEIYDRTLDMHISNLRKKLKGSKLNIVTCRGFGFKLVDESHV